MKPLKLADYQVVDDRNAMDHEKAILADAHEAALCMTGGMSYRGTDMALRIQRLITLAMAQQHALTTVEEQHAAATKRMVEAEQDKQDMLIMYKELEAELQQERGENATATAAFDRLMNSNMEAEEQFNSMQE
jgi:hypothetical protein